MEIKKLHSWYLTEHDAEVVQNKLRLELIIKTKFGSVSEIKTVAGVDVHFYESDNIYASAAVTVFDFSTLELIETKVVSKELNLFVPYKPSFLSFRELPSILDVLENLDNEPDIIITDGHGVAHPRQMGLAAHLGVLTNKPTVGCAKSLLYGTHDDPPPIKGGYSLLKDPMMGQVIGHVLTTKTETKPLYVSPGHLMETELASDIIMKCCTKYRLPEPIRIAHQLAKQKLKHNLSNL